MSHQASGRWPRLADTSHEFRCWMPGVECLPLDISLPSNYLHVSNHTLCWSQDRLMPHHGQQMHINISVRQQPEADHNITFMCSLINNIQRLNTQGLWHHKLHAASSTLWGWLMLLPGCQALPSCGTPLLLPHCVLHVKYVNHFLLLFGCKHKHLLWSQSQACTAYSCHLVRCSVNDLEAFLRACAGASAFQGFIGHWVKKSAECSDGDLQKLDCALFQSQAVLCITKVSFLACNLWQYQVKLDI